jgi:hypothetical protein
MWMLANIHTKPVEVLVVNAMPVRHAAPAGWPRPPDPMDGRIGEVEWLRSVACDVSGPNLGDQQSPGNVDDIRHQVP